jgi:hypothetical protein
MMGGTVNATKRSASGKSPLNEETTYLKGEPKSECPTVPLEDTAKEVFRSTTDSAPAKATETTLVTFHKESDSFETNLTTITSHAYVLTIQLLQNLQNLTAAELTQQRCVSVELAAANEELRALLKFEEDAKAALAAQVQQLRAEIEMVRKLIPPPESKLSVTERLAMLRRRIISDPKEVTQIVATLELESRTAENMRLTATRTERQPLTGWELD